MSLERRDGYWLWVGGPVAPGAAAITIGPVILMRRQYVQDARLLRHELQHVRQYREYGLVGFFRWYLRAYVRARLAAYPHLSAYRRIPFEVEAEWRARRMTVDHQDARDMPPLTP
jgi:Domain of unknown function (DUF4157)